MKKSIIITGSSSGFGMITAKTLAKAGHKVFATMRGAQSKNKAVSKELAEWAAANKAELEVVDMDILDEASVKDAMKYMLSSAGKIDVLINNAGMLVFGITEAFTPEQVLNVFNTNVIGAMRVNRAVLPHFRKNRDGLIVYIGSVTSAIISPFQGPYVASKSAEDKIAETTHYEVSRFGIDSVIIQPGAYTQGTNHFPGAQKPADQEIVDAYTPIADLPGHLVTNLQRIVAEGGKADVQDVANAVLKTIETPKGKRSFRVVIDPQHHGAEPINEVSESMQTKFMERLGIADLMKVK